MTSTSASAAQQGLSSGAAAGVSIAVIATVAICAFAGFRYVRARREGTVAGGAAGAMAGGAVKLEPATVAGPV